MFFSSGIRFPHYLFVSLFAFLFSCFTQLFWCAKLLSVSHELFISFVSLVVLISFNLWGKRTGLAPLIVYALMIYFLGCAYISWRGEQYLQHRLPQYLEQKEVYVQGYVLDLPKRDYGNEANSDKRKGGSKYLFRQDFDFRVSALYPCDLSQGECLPLSEHHSPGKLRLSIYGDKPAFKIKGGDRYQFLVKLKRPRSSLNFSGFDYETWLFANGYHAKGYVRAKGNNRYLGKKKKALVYFREKVRTALITVFEKGGKQSLKDFGVSEAQAFILALVLGDRTYLMNSQKALLAQTGTSHLLAISGLHIALVNVGIFYLAFLVIRFCVYLGSGSSRALTPLFAKRAAVLVSLFLTLFYALLSGFSLPAQRAFIMVCCYSMSFLFLRKVNFFLVWLLSLLLVLLWDPFCMLLSSVYLSFFAVFVIQWSLLEKNLAAVSGWQALFAEFNQLVRVQFAVSLGLIPLLATFFSRFFLLSFICNLLAIPWVSLIALPLSLLFSLLVSLDLFAGFHFVSAIELPVLWLTEASFNVLLFFLNAFNQSFPWQWFLHISVSGVLILCFVFLVLLSPLPFLVRSLSWVILVSLLSFLSHAYSENELIPDGQIRMKVLDVGQGLAVIIETSHHRLVYDTGPSFGEDFDAGLSTIIPVLQAGVFLPWREAHLDKMVLSHGDSDHIGGAVSVMKAVKIDEVLAYPRKLYPPKASFNDFDNWNICAKGKKWLWDGVMFEVLWPEKGADLAQESSNNRSCVIRVSSRNVHVLLTGDMEKQVERRLLADNNTSSLETDVLISPHHGSNTSNSQSFLKAIKPSIVIFSTGYLNRFGHPNHKVVERINRDGIQSCNTAYQGEIVFDSWKLEKKDYMRALTFARIEKNAFWRF